MISPESCLSSHENHRLNLNYVLIYWFESLSWGVEFSDSYPYWDFVVKKKTFNVLLSSVSKGGAKSEKINLPWGSVERQNFFLCWGPPLSTYKYWHRIITFIYLNTAAIRKLICSLKTFKDGMRNLGFHRMVLLLQNITKCIFCMALGPSD